MDEPGNFLLVINEPSMHEIRLYGAWLQGGDPEKTANSIDKKGCIEKVLLRKIAFSHQNLITCCSFETEMDFFIETISIKSWNMGCRVG